MPRQLPLFDQRIGNVESPANELESILKQIRLTSDRIAGEDWTAYYERTLLLAQAEYTKRMRRRLAGHPNSTPTATPIERARF